MSESTSTVPQNDPNSDLPSSITVSTFAAARIKEIQALRRVLAKSSGVKLAFQKLPRHMRRRAMSHHVKRLPRRLREIHANQMRKSGPPPIAKRPCRRHRRRPRDLVAEYASRRRRVRWLHTHIWHAKRFHMVERWGYKLPDRPCDKSFKACYRASAQHCLIQDVSYNQCIELSGNQVELVEGLKNITDSSVGLTFGAKCFINGKRGGEVTVFEANMNDLGFRKAIGQVEFLWDPNCNVENRMLWIFVHPAFYNQLLNTLTLLFVLEAHNMETDGDVESPTYRNSNRIMLRELGSELGKFRLTGPLSTSVLINAFKLVYWGYEDTPLWANNYPLHSISRQNKVWNSVSSVDSLSPGLMLPILVRDPRLHIPEKRTKSWPEDVALDGREDIVLQNVIASPLWSSEVRKYVKEHKISNADISEMRSKMLVPGSDLDFDGEAVPIVLLWRSGQNSKGTVGYAKGWDLILPTSWCQSFFVALVMWGARVGGLRETQSIAFERSQSELLSPDTRAGCAEEQRLSEELKEQYFRLPPNKRPNFNRFATASPFCFNWKMLTQNWCGKSCEDFFVLRDRNLLNNVQVFLNSKSKHADFPSLPENCLIPVEIQLKQKGLCSKFDMICIARAQDLKKEPVEPTQKDGLAKKRNEMRKNHRMLLKRLRKRRKRAKDLRRPIIPTDRKLLENYRAEMRKLWLPEPENIRNSCSREIMGFLRHGDYSFTLGRSKGLGYIVAKSLCRYATLQCRNTVLVRSTSSRQYRRGQIDVII